VFIIWIYSSCPLRHEHLYLKVQKNLISSDTFHFASSKSNLKDCQVILCTLSMLSNARISNFTKEIPLKTLVVDEASQIEVGNYISIFTEFKDSLRKLCFIGDDKQCMYYFTYVYKKCLTSSFSTTLRPGGFTRPPKYFRDSPSSQTSYFS
jgi:hypothetical protein